MVTYILFGALGVVMSMCGISIVDDPLKFISILVTVLLISISSKMDW